MDQDCRTPKTDEQIRTNTNPEPLYLFGVGDGLDVPGSDASGDGIEQNEPPMLFGINVHIPDIEYGYDLVKLSLFSDPETAPFRNKDVIGMRLLTDSGSNEAFGLVETWYNTCSLTSSDLHVVPPLPTRVLDVGPSDGSEEPKLLITNGFHASYAALSHCWGKHRILTTTSKNLVQHCKIIRFSSLAKTFQDAIQIVRFLNLRYLWIDSLCIVQDDAEDWHKESVQMGRIYKDSEITIAASGARDGSEGCFVPRPPLQPVIRLPYGEAKQGEYMCATLFPDALDTTVSETPLGSRAWITQEWMLSPRVIHYTKARMVWACRTLLKCEDGEIETSGDEQRLFESARRYRQAKDALLNCTLDLEDEEKLGFYADWCDLVSTYAARNLTYESDKPVAILGLATEVGKGIGETYTSGVFHDDSLLHEEFHAHCILTQLLWFAKSTLTRPPALQDQPSWSWTSTIGAVSFLAPARTAQSRIMDLHRVQPKASASSWRFVAQLKKWEARREGDPSHRSGDDYHAMEFYPKGSITYGGFVTQKTKLFSGRDMTPAGWAVFDLDDWPPEPFYLAMISANELDGNPDGFNVMFLAEARTDPGLGTDRQFERLGVGQIVDQTWFDQVEPETIILI
ncbi:heterokaryon incompatibility protein [Colletotrichum orchidophilum]|uniref:Heterokaryon incompatibility protein n=1 Tax=Colletotrichum orchidophilum TaxID=1209926 RepID=A0A1G4BRW6_9PEZI|nr:heterokaryon incompatibility protein [Colletotrichum orchidophilum]OHF04123.1 heterokaryon incompatibility protein [Colletotrichum orchidophilum]